MKSDTRLSLNDTLMVGPTIQEDIQSLILRFRLYPYVATSTLKNLDQRELCSLNRSVEMCIHYKQYNI